VGASSVVLMQIATNTLQDMIQNETIDTMTQYAVEGSTMVQNVAMQEKLSGADVFPSPSGDINNCYVIDQGADDQYSFRKTGEEYLAYTVDTDRNIYKDEALVQEDQDSKFFRIFCIENYSASDHYIVVKIVVGLSSAQTVNGVSITKGSSVKDYTYFTVVNL